jgi:hypothetical protein
MNEREEEVQRLENRGGAAAAREETPAPLFNPNQAEDLRRRWNDLQIAFVDEPRDAVKQADELVAFAMKQLTDTFSQERSKLEQQWDRGDQVSTEDLRLALQRYRSFFNRLLAI